MKEKKEEGLGFVYEQPKPRFLISFWAESESLKGEPSPFTIIMEHYWQASEANPPRSTKGEEE